jgi:hypothetical protein
VVALSPVLVAIVSGSQVYLAPEIQELLSEGGSECEVFSYLELASVERNL